MSLLTKLFLFSFITAFLSCTSSNNSKGDKLLEFIANEREIKVEDLTVSNILILTEDGCPNCNKSFAKLLEEQITNSKTQLIVSAKGNYVDISTFVDSVSRGNIIYDFNKKYEALNLPDGTCAIFLNQMNEIDTIIPIKAKRLSQTLTYIENKLSN